MKRELPREAYEAQGICAILFFGTIVVTILGLAMLAIGFIANV